MLSLLSGLARGRGAASAGEYFSGRDSLRLRAERMSARVKKDLPVLKRIREMGNRAKREYVRKCDREFLDCISECTKNVIKGNVPIGRTSDDKLASQATGPEGAV